MKKFVYERKPKHRTQLQLRYGNKDYNVEQCGVFFIAGDRGSYKSTFARILCGAALNDGKPYCNYWFRDFKDKKVVLIDTEQAGDKVHEDTMNLLDGLGFTEKPPNFEVYMLAEHKTAYDKRKEFNKILEEVRETAGLIIIDNGRDLLVDSSSSEEAKELMDFSNAWATENDVLVGYISHLTDSSRGTGFRKLFGFFGSHLNNVASCGFMMVPLVDSALVVPHKNRWGEWATVEFSIDKKGHPVEGEYCPFPIKKK